MRRAVLLVALVAGCAATADPQKVFDRAADAERRLGRSGERALDAVAALASSMAPVARAARETLEGATALEDRARAELESPNWRRWLVAVVLVCVVVHVVVEERKLKVRP